jgi:hypothetical protein
LNNFLFKRERGERERQRETERMREGEGERERESFMINFIFLLLLVQHVSRTFFETRNFCYNGCFLNFKTILITRIIPYELLALEYCIVHLKF